MRVRNRRKLLFAALLICFAMSVSPCAHAQFHAGATIALTAILPSSVSLSDTQLPVTIVVSNGTQVLSNAVLHIKWNLDVRAANGFRVIGTLVRANLPATALEARTASGVFRPLRPNGSIVLLEKVISAANRQGELDTPIQLQVNTPALGSLADGVYQCWLKLEVEIL